MPTHKALRGGGTIDNRSFIENSAFVAGDSTVGPDSYIGNGAFVGAGTTIGARVLICNLVRIGAGSTIGDDVTIECGNVLPAGSVIAPGSTLLDPCCATPPIPPEGAMLQFDSVNVVGTRLAVFDTTGFTKGTLSYVGNDTFPTQNSVHDYYSLVYGEALTPDGLDVVNSPTFGVDGAQWLRQHFVNQQFINKLFWAIDPVGGSDENTGWGTTQIQADSRPLKTMRCLNTRLNGAAYDTTVFFHQLTDMAVSEALSNVTTKSGLGYPVWQGTETELFAGLVSVYAPSVPAAETGVQITIPTLPVSFTGSGLVGSMVRSTDGLRWAWVVKDLGAKTALISQPVSGDAVVYTYPTPQVFVPGELLHFVRHTAIPDWPFGPTKIDYSALTGVELIDDGSFPLGQLGNTVCYHEKTRVGIDLSSGVGGAFANIFSGCFFSNRIQSGQAFGGLKADIYYGGFYATILMNYDARVNLLGQTTVLQRTVFNLAAFDLVNGSSIGSFLWTGPNEIGFFDFVITPMIRADDKSNAKVVNFHSALVLYGSGNSQTLVFFGAGIMGILPDPANIFLTSTPLFILEGLFFDLPDLPILLTDSLTGLHSA